MIRKEIVENMLSGLVDWKAHTTEWVFGERFEEYRKMKKRGGKSVIF